VCGGHPGHMPLLTQRGDRWESLSRREFSALDAPPQVSRDPGEQARVMIIHTVEASRLLLQILAWCKLVESSQV